MISKKLLYSKVLGLAVAALTFVACTDTWDDHYESLGSGTNSMHEGSLWQAISTNSNLSNFARFSLFFFASATYRIAYSKDFCIKVSSLF